MATTIKGHRWFVIAFEKQLSDRSIKYNYLTEPLFELSIDEKNIEFSFLLSRAFFFKTIKEAQKVFKMVQKQQKDIKIFRILLQPELF